MKVCPIAIAVGCPKCPAFKICPAKETLGGYKEPESGRKSAEPSKGKKKG
ncbi:MAG: hypothetical protein JNM76_12125 [Betaproteobacteria bacterium]|nr:hypothetical protein [Betaproteobacteria bacterium]